jgi:DNA-binding Xre family transcriptional regulator
MAITIAARTLAKKLLKNKKLKKAINVTTKQTTKLKNAAKSGAA